jgi:hypothetical protein
MCCLETLLNADCCIHHPRHATNPLLLLLLLLLLLGAGTTAVYSADGGDSFGMRQGKMATPGGGKGGSKPINMLAFKNVGRGLLGASTKSILLVLCAFRVKKPCWILSAAMHPETQ